MPEDDEEYDEETLIRWEREDYIFRHNYYRVEQAAKRLSRKDGSFSLSLSVEEGGPLETEIRTPDDDATMEFALAMAKFLRSGSDWSIEHYMSHLREIGGTEHAEFLDQAQQTLDSIKTGRMKLKAGEREWTAQQAYQTMAERVIFANDLDAIKFLNQLDQDPSFKALLWKLYHDYCLDSWKLLQQIHTYREENGLYPPSVDRDPHCIYCSTQDGDFSHVEHTLPEALGNELSFLPRGFVCGRCKDQLDELEDGIQKVFPFSMVLPFTRLGSKKGKLPKSKFAEVHVEKKSPNRIVFEGQLDRPPFESREHEDGVELTWTTKGRFDAHKVARILYKAALGAIALEKGRDHALDKRFDGVREYILEGGTFPNKLGVFKEGVPGPGIQMRWIEFDGTPACDFILLGFRFMIVLGDEPPMEPHDLLKPHLILLDLSKESPEDEPESWEG